MLCKNLCVDTVQDLFLMFSHIRSLDSLSIQFQLFVCSKFFFSFGFLFFFIKCWFFANMFYFQSVFELYVHLLQVNMTHWTLKKKMDSRSMISFVYTLLFFFGYLFLLRFNFLPFSFANFHTINSLICFAIHFDTLKCLHVVFSVQLLMFINIFLCFFTIK